MGVRGCLSVARLCVDRGGRPVLRDVSFSLSSGGAMVVTGSNGTGKSTLLRALAGLIPRLSGTVQLTLDEAGFAPSASDKGERVRHGADLFEETHYLGHANGLKLALTAEENLRFFADWGGAGGMPPDAALDAVGLGHIAEFPVGVLSAGQRRRVAVARLLVARRPLWLLDEPATALDAASEAVLARLMRLHLDAGGLIVAAVHSPLDLPARELRLGAA